ncbi:MAG: TatD family hydrolase [Patescibacteria group bacterium]
MKYIDIHCHLDFPDYDKDRDGVFARMVDKQVGVITIGTDLESSKRAVEIAEENENVWACIGIHPNEGAPSLVIREGLSEVRGDELFSAEEFQTLVQNPKVVAIGECGLDYFRIKDESEKDIQKKLFIEQIEFALKHNKPLMLHCRNSYDDVLDILESYKEAAGPEAEKLRGNAHFFAGDIEQAKRFLDLGFSMSFTGVITFTHDYDEVIKYLPMNAIMSETDAPFVAPVPYRGKRNEPPYVIEVVKKIAEIKGIDKAFCRETILQNAKNMFGLLK